MGRRSCSIRRGSFKTPDAIQLATASIGNADFFLTNDAALGNAPNIQVIVLKDLVKDPSAI